MSAQANAANKETMTISVIMPAYNAAHYLEKSLPPLIAMRDRCEILEVLVVDDCSTQASNVETAERLGATVVKMAQNGGPAAARNHAAKLARGTILWLVDADVVAHENGAKILKGCFADEKIAAVFGSYDRTPPAENFASQYKNLIHRYYHQRGKEESDTFWSGCGAIRKSVYVDLGGFDGARYGRPSIEDIEFGFRMRTAGWAIRLSHELQCTHLKHWNLAEVVRTDIFQRAVPWSYLILSGRGVNNDLNVSRAERFKAGVAGLWFLSIAASIAPWLWPAAPATLAILTTIVAYLNRDLLGFFKANRGAIFALKAAAYHQFYYVYSATTFVACAFAYHIGGKRDVIVGRTADGKAIA